MAATTSGSAVAIALMPEPCPGRRSTVWNRRWPICSLCDIQDDNGTAEPAAVMQGDQPVCVNRRFHGGNVRASVLSENPAGLGGSVCAVQNGQGFES